MHLHIDLYRQEKDNFIMLLKKVIARMAEVDPVYKDLDVKKTLYRQNKDIRFTRDKRPYKKHFGARISPDGKNGDFAGMYIHVEKDRSYLAVGMRQPAAVVWKKVREYMAAHYKELESILEDKTVRKTFGKPHGERTNRLLKKYADHPARKLLKYKSLYFYHDIPNKVVIAQNFDAYIFNEWLIMKPFIDFLNDGAESFPIFDK